MFRFCKDIKKELNSKTSSKKLVVSWMNGLDEIIECIDDNEYSEESDSEKIVQFDNINFFIKDVLKTLQLFDEKGITQHKRDKQLLNVLSKIITRHLFKGNIELDEEDLLVLLNFIKWDCALLFQYAEDWITSEEAAGYDIIDVMKLAKKYKKKYPDYIVMMLFILC